MIGNPIGLIDKVGTGVVELFSEPIKGFVKNPKYFAKGMGKGARSLVGNVVEGSFDSVTKITGSLYGLMKVAGGET